MTRKWIIRSVGNITVLLGVGITLGSLAGHLGTYSWFFDTLSHFKWQYFLGLLPVMALLALLKRWIWLGMFGMALFITSLDMLPLYWGGQKDTSLPSYVKIVCMNVLTQNRQYDKAIAYLQSKDPDIIVLEEMDAKWQRAMQPVLKAYPYQSMIPRSDNFGIGLASKIPLSDVQEVDLAKQGVPSIQATFQWEEKPINILATHPLPPSNNAYYQRRNAQLKAISERVSNSNQPWILIGDLNTSSYSNHFKDMVAESGLVDSRKGFGILSSWPEQVVWMRITLDHCLVSPPLKVRERATGDAIGSDHLPIYIELGW